MAEEILVVEDNRDTAQFLGLRLKSIGFQVHTEETGQAALNYAAEHRPDLVILDIRLPDINGYEVCKSLRRLYDLWTPPILMLTGLNEPVDKLRGFAHGADAYLTKPCNLAEIVKTVAFLLGEPLS